MAERKISYLARNYDDYRNAILDITRKYYGDVFDNMNDASVGSWIVDIVSDIGDNLSYNIDRAYQETSIDSANDVNSLFDMARTSGCKITGKKAAIVEVELSCELPLNRQGTTSDGDLSQADESYAPIVKRGTLFSTGLQTFELSEDVDFSKQFNDEGISNRQIIPTRDSNGNIISYLYKKLAIATAGQSKVYKKIVTNSDLVPFMEVQLEDADILGVESIIVKEGTTIVDDPSIDEFYVDEEEYVDKKSYSDFGGNKVSRFFEVDNLAEQYRYGYEIEMGDKYYNPRWEVAEMTYIEMGEGLKGDYEVYNYGEVINKSAYESKSDEEKKDYEPWADYSEKTGAGTRKINVYNLLNVTIPLNVYRGLTKEEQARYVVNWYVYKKVSQYQGTIDGHTYNTPYQYVNKVEDSNGNRLYPNDIISAEEYNDLGVYQEGEEEKESTRTIFEAVPARYVVRGDWKRVKNKFVTEYTNTWALKIIFGKGLKNQYGEIPVSAREFTKYMMCRMEANDYMGVLPDANSTMYILYRVGGGEQSNIAPDTLTNFIYKNIEIGGNCDDNYDATKKRKVLDSLKVTNTTPSYGGKDEPSFEEMRWLIKYNNASQNRCVTLHDYYARIMTLPAKYGCPFRCGIVEENNKVIIYMLGIDQDGRLRSELAEQVATNIKNYLSKYRMINDLVEMRSGKIINLAFDVDIFVDKTYDKGEVVKRVIDLIYDYMDVRKHKMGEDVFVGDIEKEISKLDGVQNLIELRVYNKVGSYDGYSDNETTQELMSYDECGKLYDEDRNDLDERRIDLKKSDKILFTESNSMFEIKYKEKDIRVNVKQRS